MNVEEMLTSWVLAVVMLSRAEGQTAAQLDATIGQLETRFAVITTSINSLASMQASLAKQMNPLRKCRLQGSDCVGYYNISETLKISLTKLKPR